MSRPAACRGRERVSKESVRCRVTAPEGRARQRNWRKDGSEQKGRVSKVGVLTEQTRRLCEGIVTWRNERHALLAELKSAVSTLCAELSSQRREMAQRTKATRASFLSGLRGAVAAQQEEYRADRAGARLVWAAQQEEYRADRAGARLAWGGIQTASPVVLGVRSEAPARPPHFAREAPRKAGKRERHH